MAGHERVMLSSTGQLIKPAWAPPFPTTQAPSPEPIVMSEGPEPPRAHLSDPSAIRRRRSGPSRVIALVEASQAGAERLAAATAKVGQAIGLTVIALALEPRGRLAAALTEVPVVTPPPDLTPESLTAQLTDLQRRADLIVVDLGCRWVPALFRPVLTRATEIWLVGEIGQWGALETRQSQAEFSGWTDLDRLRLFALGPADTAGPTQLGEPITILEVTEPSLTSFAESYWRRQSG